MATIRARGDRWQVMIRHRGQQPVTKTFTSKKDAEAWARITEVAIERGVFIDRSDADKVTLGEVIAKYRDQVTVQKRGCDQETTRLNALARHHIARLALSSVTARVIAEYREERLLAVSGSTVNRELNVLSSLINHCIKEWMIPLACNPVAGIRRPKQGKSRDRLLDDDEEKRLFAAIEEARNPYLEPVVRFALSTAMRRGEILSLRWSDVEIAKRVAHIEMSKNGSGRDVPLSSQALEVLQRLPRPLASDSPVFPLSANALKLAWQRSVKRAGLENLTFHDLRHCAATRLSERLPNLIELSSVTGHKTLAMLKRYYHPKAELLALKLG